MTRRLRLTLRLLVIAAIAAALWWFVRKLDIAALGRAFASARVWPLVVASTLNFAIMWGKAAAWRLMLAPRHVVRVGRLFRYTIAAYATSAIMPARAGEVVRVWALERRDGVPVADTAAVAVAEKLLDGISMLILVAPLPWVLPELPGWVGGSIAVCSAIAVLALVAAWIGVGRVDPATTRWIGRFIAGMHALRNGKRLLGALAALLFTWLVDLAMMMLVMHAIGIEPTIAMGLLTLFTINLTIMVPSTPAQVGALEVGALAGLDLLHVPHEPALAFALLYHAIQFVPVVTAGLVLELPLMFKRD